MTKPNPAHEIQRALRTTGGYRTRADLDRTWLDRRCGRCDLYLYARIAAEVATGGRRAGRGRYTADYWAGQSARIVRLMERCGGRVNIEGMLPLLSETGPVVYVANHMSMAETMMLPCILLTNGMVTFVVKNSLLRYPAMGRVLRYTAAIGVGRANPREDFRTVMTEGARRLAEGRSVVVFPQATRMVAFAPAAFNSLGVKLARQTGVPLAPLALKTDFMGVGRLLRDAGPIDRAQTLHFRFGKPFRVTDARRDHAAVTAFIAAALREWGAVVNGGGS